jgi:DNA replication regulator SLD3
MAFNRETRTQIQILLHMLLLSNSNVPHIATQASSPRKSPPTVSPRKRRRYEIEEEEPELTLDDQLEFFMDKLSVWQLLNSLETREADSHQNDFAQDFCADIIEPLSVN